MIAAKELKPRLAIIDDKKDSLYSTADEFSDSHFEPVPLRGPYSSVKDLLEECKKSASAALCDHHLTHANYVPSDGAQLMKLFYSAKFPAVLRTGWAYGDFYEIRRFRRYIPVLLNSDAGVESVVRGLEICVDEFNGKVLASRRPWPTLLRVEDVSEDRRIVSVIVVGWSSKEVVPFPADMIEDSEILRKLAPGVRLNAEVNTGAESNPDLYFCNFKFVDNSD